MPSRSPDFESNLATKEVASAKKRQLEEEISLMSMGATAFRSAGVEPLNQRFQELLDGHKTQLAGVKSDLEGALHSLNQCPEDLPQSAKEAEDLGLVLYYWDGVPQVLERGETDPVIQTLPTDIPEDSRDGLTFVY